METGNVEVPLSLPDEGREILERLEKVALCVEAVKVLECSPSACVVLEVPGKLSHPERMRDMAAKCFGCRTVILEGGIKLAGIVELKEGPDGSN